MEDGRLFCKGGGCTAKLGPKALSTVLQKLSRGPVDANLLVGFDSSDDAAVYRLSADLAMVQTLDFFPPMVEDPYIFGQIAAANALSDIYAMGGEVKTALNIVCFPEAGDLNILGEILQGGNAKVIEAGGVLAGGHSIADPEIKYGLSVTGVVHPDHIYTNNGGRAGDVLILTKPLGTGIICTARRIGEASEAAMAAAVCSMTTLNKYAAEIMKQYEVHACTDVTGFGLIGHLGEMLNPGLTAILFGDQIPCIPEARAYAGDFFLTAAGQRNRNHAKGWVDFRCQDFALEEMLFDPQTSGGLLMAVAPADADFVLEKLSVLDLACGRIGELHEGVKRIIVN